MAPSGDIGDQHALFQPSHGTAPSIAGKNMANPIAMVLSSKMMLSWLGEKHGEERLITAGEEIEDAVKFVLKEGIYLTRDIGGKAGTSQVGDALVQRIRTKN